MVIERRYLIGKHFVVCFLFAVAILSLNFKGLRAGDGELRVFDNLRCSLSRCDRRELSFSQSGFTLEKGYPRPRMFTPNGDGRNDEVNFSYRNGNLSSVVCMIYDARGFAVRQLKIDALAEEGQFSWDGKDQNGNLVLSGVYIYQIEVEGKVLNGTLVVVR